MKAVELPNEARREASLRSLRRESTDPLENPNFEVGQYIDSFFPEEPTPEAIAALSQNLKQKLKDADKEIKNLLLDENDQSRENLKRLEAIRSEIKNLHQKIISIKAKSTEAELAVRGITNDIKTLDYAKKNLTQTIIVFKRLQMLDGGIKQIQELLPQKAYKETVHLFDASIQLMNNFDGFLKVKEIARLNNNLQKLISDAKNQVMFELQRGINVHGVIVGSSETLSNTCKLANSIGYSEQVISYYVDTQLRGYRDIFQLNDDVSQLENISRRYSWLIRILRNYTEEHASIFPTDWNVDLALSIKFCFLTRDMITEQLRNAERIDIDIMISALTSSIAFESQLDKKFNISKQVDKNTGKIVFLDDNGIKRDPFKFCISPVFSPYLFRYIATEDRLYSELIQNSRNIESDILTYSQKDLIALSSSTDLLYRYREDLRKCAIFSTGKLLFDLFKLFNDKMQSYTKIVLSPNISRIAVLKMDSIEKTNAMCLVINTADYCVTSVSQLEERMVEKIDKEFKSQISFEESHNTLMNAINNGIDSLVDISLELCNTGFLEQSNLLWTNKSGVVDQLEYVYLICSALEESVIQTRLLLKNASYFRTFCDRLSVKFFNRYIQSLKQLQKIDEVGAEQLLLDFQPIKSTVLQLPRLQRKNQDELSLETFSAKALSSYTETVAKKAAYVESILKALLAPIDDPEKFVNQYISLFSDSSIETFEQILAFKGVRGAGNSRKFFEALKRGFGGSESMRSSSEIRHFRDASVDSTPRTGQTASTQSGGDKNDRRYSTSGNNYQYDKIARSSQPNFSALQKFASSLYSSPQPERPAKSTNPFHDSVSPIPDLGARTANTSQPRDTLASPLTLSNNAASQDGVKATMSEKISGTSIFGGQRYPDTGFQGRISNQAALTQTELQNADSASSFDSHSRNSLNEPGVENLVATRSTSSSKPQSSSSEPTETITSPILSNIAANAAATKNILNLNFRRIVSNMKTRKTPQ